MSSKTHIIRGAGLIQNPLAEMRDVIYDESDVETIERMVTLPSQNALGSPISIAGESMVVGDRNSIPANSGENYKLQYFVYRALKSNKTEYYWVYLKPVEREVTISYKNGRTPSGIQLYEEVTVKVQDLVYYTEGGDSSVNLVLSSGGFKIFDGDPGYQTYITYNWNDNEYGNPNNGIVLFRQTFTNEDGRWIATGTDVPIYYNKNNDTYWYSNTSYYRINDDVELRTINAKTACVHLKAHN